VKNNNNNNNNNKHTPAELSVEWAEAGASYSRELQPLPHFKVMDTT
jgi:hypothetical protein